MKRKISSLALMFMSMAMTLHLTDRAARCSQEIPPGPDSQIAERCLPYVDSWSLPSGGIGALIECEPSGVRLVSCLPGHAGDRAGLRVGDRIVGINGQSTTGGNEAWAMSQLRGKIGTKMVLDVERGEGLWQRTFRTHIERANIQTEYSVYSRLRGNELVVKVFWLGPNTAEQLANHLSQIGDQSIDRVVLDLTNVSSGDFKSLQECASLFLPQGTVVGQYASIGEDRSEQLNKVTTVGYPFTDKLTAVKVGPYTARFGEVLARALSDNLDIDVEGDASAGLGTLDGRTIRSRGEAADFGTKLYDAKGRSIDGNPLKPGFWTWSNLLSPAGSGIE